MQQVKSRFAVISVAGVYEVKSEASSHVIRIMTRTIMILAITTVFPSAELLHEDTGRGFEPEKHVDTLELEMLERELVEPAGRNLAGSRRKRPHGFEVCVWR